MVPQQVRDRAGVGAQAYLIPQRVFLTAGSYCGWSSVPGAGVCLCLRMKRAQPAREVSDGSDKT